MFTRLLASSLKRATQSLSRPPMSTFSSLQPMKLVHMQTTNLLLRTTMVPSNLHIQNLLEFLQKCEQELQMKDETNSLTQLCLLSQGKSIPSIIKMIDFDHFFGVMQIHKQDQQNYHRQQPFDLHRY